MAKLLASLDPAGVDLRAGLAGPLAVTTITRFLGLVDVEAADVARLVSIDLAGHHRSDDRGWVDDAGRRAVAEIHRRVQLTLDPADRNDASEPSLLAAIRADGGLELDELGSTAAVLMFGAIETSEAMIANLLWHLLTTDGAWSTVRRDRKLLTNAIEESLRLEPAAAVIDRYTTGQTELGGVTMAAGELVTLSLLAANHDPTFFDRPDEFMIDRSNARQHVTFAQGPHACLGPPPGQDGSRGGHRRPPRPRSSTPPRPGRSRGPTGLIFRKPDTIWVDWA